jgi:hypothetical protein
VAAEALLAAVRPGQVALALAAAEEVTAWRQRSVRAAELAAERARHEADRAERAFLACEPENRLVARTLEARWETRLAGLADAEAALAAQRSAQPELPAPDQLAATVADLPALWADPATSDKDRKRLLRALLADVTITPDGQDRTRLLVGPRWKSGASQQVQVTRRKNAFQLRSTDAAAVELARRIGPALDNRPELPPSPYHGMQRRPCMPAGAGVAGPRSVPPARHRRGLGPSSRFPAERSQRSNRVSAHSHVAIEPPAEGGLDGRRPQR